ncbi:hypothetical protein FACS1894211_01360 [Clostridia bacterium]|nr:hypothetical protein FACS1894211_01360 [Clostridia bacterium]
MSACRKDDHSFEQDNTASIQPEQKQTCILAFETNGGTYLPSVSYYKDDTASIPQTAPKKRGYPFEAWYTDKACTKISPMAFKITNSMTLYAQWGTEFPIYAIRLFRFGTQYSSDTCYAGESINTPPEPRYPYDGYQPPFYAWYLDASFQERADFPYVPTKSTTNLYARWGSYTVGFYG